MITSQVSSVTYAPNGVTTVFSITFPFLVNAEVDVFLTIDGVRSEVVSGITLAGAGDPSGGTVTFAVAPVSGSTLLIERNTVAKQEVDYVNNDAFEASSNESQMDRLAMTIIDAKRVQGEGLARSIRVPVGETAGELPAATLRAGEVLYFNADTGEVETKTPNEILLLSDGAPDGVGLPSAGTTGQYLKALGAGLGEWGNLTQAELQTAIDDKPDFRNNLELKPLKISSVATAGTSVSAGVRTANSTAIQALYDEAGAAGRPVDVSGGPWEIDDEIVINYQGQRTFGDAWNYEVNNKSRIIQTAAGQPAFRVAIPAGGAVSTHMITFEDLWISGPGEGTSTKAGIDFYLDGPVGSVFSDFNNIKRVRIDGFAQGLRLSKFSNSTIEQVGIFDCTDAVHIGGNCNAVNFVGCQFNTFPTAGKAFWFIGSGYINVIGCEYGNGGAFLGFDSGVIAVTLDIVKLAVENQEASSVVASTNTVNINGIRLLGGSYPGVVPFKFENTSFGSINNDSMSGFTAGVPFAYGTLSAVPVRRSNQFSTVAPNPIEIYADNTFASLQFKYGFHDGKGIADNSTLTAGENFRGLFQYRLNRDVNGVNGFDVIEVCLKNQGSFEWVPITATAARATANIIGTSYQLLVNQRVRASNASTRVVFTLPATAKVDDEIEIIGRGAAGWRINQNATQYIQFGSVVTTTGVTGYMESTNAFDVVRLKCISASGAGYWQVISNVGTPTVA